MHADSRQIFLCACDMPFLKVDVIKFIVDSVEKESITLPLVNSLRQPLHAIYKKEILPVVESLLRVPEAYLPELFEKVPVHFLEENSFAHIPGYELSFVNINDPETAARYFSFLGEDQV
jgi:molybdopterin-guanine dinucleotide biosynthesis protein A